MYLMKTLFVVFLFFSICWAEVRNLNYDNRKISYLLTEPDTVVVEIKSNSILEPVVIYAGRQEPGEYILFWNGKDNYGNTVPSGQYTLTVYTGRTIEKDEKFGEGGFLQLTNPASITVDSKGNLYVLDFEKAGLAWYGKAGNPKLFKFNPDGTPSSDFKPLTLPAGSRWIEIKDDLLFYSSGQIYISDLSGKVIRRFGGVEKITDEKGNRVNRPGSEFTNCGIGFGEGNKVYIRGWSSISVFDSSKSDFDGYLYSVRLHPTAMPPVDGIWVGPSICVDRKAGIIYLTSRGGLFRYIEKDDSIEFHSKVPVDFFECIGLTFSSGRMLYVVERGINNSGQGSPGVYQLWDCGDGLVPVMFFENREFQGLHDVAISPDGKSLYVLEDGDNFGYLYDGTRRWPARDLQGKARLFKFNLKYKSQIQKKITIK